MRPVIQAARALTDGVAPVVIGPLGRASTVVDSATQARPRATGRGQAPLRLRGPVAKLALSGLAALLLVAVGGAIALRHLAASESIRDARQLTRLVGKGIVEPYVTDRVLAGDPRAIAALDRVVRRRVLGEPVLRVKIWTPDGRIAYSDEHRLIGLRYALGHDEHEALRTGSVAAELSDLSRPENRFERSGKKLLEVYLPLRTPSGRPVLFETYQRFSSVVAGGRKIWLAFAPAFGIALLLLTLIQLPLAWSLARRLRAEREGLLQRAIDASEAERRRIASDLHDGVAQDLAGTAYTLAALAERVDGSEPDAAAQEIRESALRVRKSVRELRSLFIEIYPPSLGTAGLELALDDLVAPVTADGIDVRVDLPERLVLAPEAEQLVFRTVQETLRNVVRHSGATRVDVRVEAANGNVALHIADDGRGFSTEELERRQGEGHVGLFLLRERAADLGARLTVESSPGAGTRVSLELLA